MLTRRSLPPLLCSYYLLRSMHCMDASSSLQPSASILLIKVDVKHACRQHSMCGKVAAMSATSLNGKAIMNFHQKFGGTFGPHLFSRNASDHTSNLANNILSCNKWEEDIISSPYLKSVLPPSLLPSSTPFSQALLTDVVVPLHLHGKIYVCSDEMIGTSPLSLPWKHTIGSSLLALCLLGHPMS